MKRLLLQQWPRIGSAGIGCRGRSICSSALFVKPRTESYPCQTCKESGEVLCDNCNGRGKLALGGYHRKNPVDLDRIVGSKWTAMERTLGWRHYEARSRQKLEEKGWFVLLAATCDPKIQLWVNIENLKDRKLWSMGWLQKSQYTQDPSVAAASGPKCKACKGHGKIQCPLCGGSKTVSSDKLQVQIIDIS